MENKKEKRKILHFSFLTRIFKNYLFRDTKEGGIDIFGYNPNTGRYIVIPDGICKQENWNLMIYQFYDNSVGLTHFISHGGFPSVGEADKLFEGTLFTDYNQ